MTDLLILLMSWIISSISYPPPLASELPEVQFKTHVELRILICGNDIQCEKRDFGGAYDYKNNVIYLRDNWDIKRKEHHGVLVHELVHFLQYKNNKKFSCRAEMEREAYSLEEKWYAKNGIQSPNDPMFIQFFLMPWPCDIWL